MELYGKKALTAQLDAAAKKGRLSHALLFSGGAGCGKKVMARYAAQLFMCAAPPCGHCTVCRSVENDSHPDVIFVKKACAGKYGIDAVRAALSDIAVLPNNGSVKIYVFEDFDGVSDKVQNHLLKMIEEPAPFVKFIFTCESASTILATILSRVAAYDVPPAPHDECVRFLRDSGCDETTANSLANNCAGSIGRCRAALEGADDEGAVAAKRAAAAIAGMDKPGLCAALTSRGDRAEFADLTALLTDVLRDALSVRCGGTAESFAANEARAIAAVFDEQHILAMLDAVFDIMSTAVLNPNIALTAARLTATMF